MKESSEPLKYWDTNVASTINLLEIMMNLIVLILFLAVVQPFMTLKDHYLMNYQKLIQLILMEGPKPL